MSMASSLAHRLRTRSLWYGMVAIATLLLLLVSTSLAPKARAQTAYPSFLDPHVNDYAQVLAANDAATMRTTLRQFQGETGIQAVVLTVESIPAGMTIESFATGLFNEWGIGDRTRNDGILLLIAPNNRELRLELGSGYPSSDNATAQRIIDEDILPHFRAERISQGTLAGVNAIVRDFHPTLGAAESSDGLASQTGTIAAVGGGTAAAGGIPALLYWRRNRQRNCPRCSTPMERLDEAADDRFLRPGQRFEESIGSVDYDIWQCPQCGHHEQFQYRNFFSGYERCPSCAVRALKSRSTVTRRATYTSTGERKITKNCRNCSYHDVEYRTIPRRTRSSSSGGGGGGRSSGGGASGSW